MSYAPVPSRVGPSSLLAFLAAFSLGACSADAPTAPVRTTGTNSQIAYTSVVNGLSRTYLMNGDGTNAHALGTVVYMDEAPVLSPDGRRIAVTSQYTGLPQVFVMATDGSGRVPVTSLQSGGLMGTWSPDGRRILFSSFDSRTYMVNADGTGLRLITKDTLDEQFPVLSPNGARIAFMSLRNSTDSVALMELYVMDADGTHAVRLTTTTGFSRGAFNEFPAWSPDGRRIAFIRQVDQTPPHVWIVNADGTDLHPVFTGATAEHSVAWSPDGRRLAFARRAFGNGHFDVFVSDLDGTNIADLTNTPDADEIFPNWGRKP